MTAVNPSSSSSSSYPPTPPPAYTSLFQTAEAQPPGTSATVVMSQPTSPGSTALYQNIPARIQCQHCGAVVITATKTRVGVMPWIIGGILCAFGCILGCCLIPCCIHDLRDVIHSCPNCNNIVGYYRLV